MVQAFTFQYQLAGEFGVRTTRRYQKHLAIDCSALSILDAIFLLRTHRIDNIYLFFGHIGQRGLVILGI